MNELVWVLILFAHAGPLSDKDSMALTSVSGFSESTCHAAGKEAVKMSNYTTKVLKYTCVKQ